MMAKEFSITNDNYDIVSKSFNACLDEILDAGGIAKIKVTNSGRSLDQNALFHVWANELSKHLTSGGREYCTFPWVKLALKATFLGTEQVTTKNVLTGQDVVTDEIRHSSNLSKGEMCNFLNQVQGWALDVNYILSAPLNSEYMKLIDKQNQ